MYSKFLLGNKIAAIVREELKETVAKNKAEFGISPGLAVILVGERRDSATYVRSKKKACAEIGINSYGFDYPSTVTQEELIAKIDELNAGMFFLFCGDILTLLLIIRITSIGVCRPCCGWNPSAVTSPRTH